MSADAVNLAAEQLLAEEQAAEAKATAKKAKRLRQKQKKQAQQVGRLDRRPSQQIAWQLSQVCLGIQCAATYALAVARMRRLVVLASGKCPHYRR